MADVPQSVITESRNNVDEWAAEARLLLATEEPTRFAADKAADIIAALGHAGAGRALADAGYVIAQITQWLERCTGQRLDGEETAALLGMAGLVLADREAGHA